MGLTVEFIDFYFIVFAKLFTKQHWELANILIPKVHEIKYLRERCSLFMCHLS